MTIMTTDSEIMDTTDQGGIQLNLKTVPDPPPPPSSSPIKTSNIRESKEEEPTKKKPSKKSKSGPHPPATQKKEDFVSGLFTGNPVIPDVGLSGASKDSLPQESLFSGSLFEGIHPFLIKNLSSQGISKPTAVQTAAIPKIIAGKDVLVKSQTGSGKTLAYALPLLHSLQAKTPPINRDSGLFALVIVPTRELALQTYEVFLKLVHSFARIVPGVLHGGEKRKSEKARLRKGINILVSTPGRLLDHIRKTKTLDMSKVEYLIFDEADRMLDLGYERDVSDILNALKENALEGASRQTVLLSATLTKGIQQLSEVSLKHPVFVDITSSDSSSVLPISEQHFETAVPEALQQTFIVVPAKLRLITLSSFILWKCKSNKKVLIFMATQDMVDYHFTLLEQSLSEERKVNFMKLHGNMDQSERTKVFNDFRDIERGTSSNGLVLLCTDVAARGLDLPKVDWIVQYNPPISTADYVHRIGRTARIGSKGSSLLFVLPSETGFLREVEEQKLASFVELTVDRVLEKVFPSDKRRSLEHAATTLQMKMEEAIARDGKLKEIGSQAYVSFIRSYASYPKEVRHLFCFKDLHLGHIAKSFGLRDAPTRITGIGKGGNWVKKQELRAKNAEIKREERVVKSQRKRIDQRALIMSEFSSGFDDMDEKPPAKKRSKK